MGSTSGDDDYLPDIEEEEEKPTGTTFDDLFPFIGGLGLAQILIYISTAVIECTCFLTMYFFIFETANPGFTCVQTMANSSSVGNRTMDTCPHSPYTCTNLTFNGDFSSIVSEWALICDKAYIPRMILSLFFVGVLFGAVLGGALGDRFGRKRALLILWPGMMISHALLALMSSWQLYLGLRMVVGVFVGGTAVISSVLPMEYISPNYRTLAGNRIGWQVGGFFLAMLAYFIRSWRYLVVVGGLFWLPLLPAMIICLPESARWLIQRGRIKEAKMWIDRIAKLNGRPKFDSLDLIDEIASFEASKQELSQTYTYLDLFTRKKYAMRTITMIFSWFATALITYGVYNNLSSLAGNLYLKLTITAAIKCGTRWTIVFMANLIGRRKSFLLYMSIATVCMFTIMALDITNHNQSYQTAITAFALISYIGLDGAWGLQFMLSTEAFPTVVRTLSMGSGNMAARIGGIVAPQIGHLAVFHTSIPYVVYGCFGLAGALLVFFIMPETKGEPLIESLPPRKPIRSGPIYKLKMLTKKKKDRLETEEM